MLFVRCYVDCKVMLSVLLTVFVARSERGQLMLKTAVMMGM